MALDSGGKLIEEYSSKNMPYIAVDKGTNARRMVLVDKNTGKTVNLHKTVKDSWNGTVDVVKSWSGDDMSYISIVNDGADPLVFTINGISITVDVGEDFNHDFDPFTSVSIVTTSPYRAIVKD